MHNLKHYDSLEVLPIYNWFKCAQLSDLRYLLRDYNSPTDVDLEALYLKLQQEYLDIFGASTEAEMLLRMIKEKIEYQYQVSIGNLWYKNHIKRLQFEIDAFSKKEDTEQQTIESSLLVLSKFMGFKNSPKETTVIEYYEMVRLLDKHNKPLENGRKDS